jgi:hypothetical protein
MTAAPKTFFEELQQLKRRMKIYNLRWHLARFPKDLLAHSWRVEGEFTRTRDDHLAKSAHCARIA